MGTSLRAGFCCFWIWALSGCGTTPAATDDAQSGNADVSSPNENPNDEKDASATGGDGTPDLTWVKESDVSYTPPPGVGGEFAKLDLYRIDDNQTRPLVVLIHGGGWVSGDKAGFDDSAPDFIPWWMARGYTVAALNFRLASRLGVPQTVRPKDQVRDIAHALAWLLQQEAYNLKQTDVVALGYSSGAHLVALLGADGSYLAEAGLPETILRATISLDVHAYDVPYALELMVDSDVEQNIPLIRHLFGETESEQREASPIAYLQGWVAPAFLVSVDQDPARAGSHGYIALKTTERYALALQEAGHVSDTFHDAAENHTTLATGFGAPGDAVTAKVGNFLDNL